MGTWGAKTETRLISQRSKTPTTCRRRCKFSLPESTNFRVIGRTDARPHSTRNFIMIFFGSEGVPLLASPKVTALQAEFARRGVSPRHRSADAIPWSTSVRLHTPSSVNGKGAPRIREIRSFSGKRPLRQGVRKTGVASSATTTPIKVYDFQNVASHVIDHEGSSLPQKPDVSVSREKSSCPPGTSKAPLIKKSWSVRTQDEGREATLGAPNAQRDIHGKTHVTHPTDPKLESCPARMGHKSRRAHVPFWGMLMGQSPKPYMIGSSPGIQIIRTAFSHANRLASSSQPRREGLFAVSTAFRPCAQKLGCL